MRMKKFIAAGLVSLGCFHSLADESREEVKVIASEPARISYGFQAPGRSPVSCFGTGCARYYASTATNGGGAVLRLLRSDASIVIVQCKAHGEAPSQSAGSGNGNPLQLAPQCMMPDASYEVAADLNPREVTLTMFRPSADGPGPITTETYIVVGVLMPTPGQQGELSGSATAAPATAADSRLAQQSQIKLDTMPALSAGSEHNAGSQTERSKSRRLRRETAEDLQGSSQLLTYLTHELIDPNRVEAKERLAAMGPVHAALSPEAPVSTPLQQEPQGITPPAEQAPLPQGPVDTAVTPAAAASTIAVSEPKAIAPAATAAPLAQGPVDTALAPAAAASTIALSEPKALPQAAKKAPRTQRPVDTALAPAAPASSIASSAPKSVSEASATENAAPVSAQVPAAPVPAQVPPAAQAPAEPTPAAPVQAQFATIPEPVAPSSAPAPTPASAPVQARPAPMPAAPVRAQVAAPPEPVAPLPPPVSRRAETANAPPIATTPRASSPAPMASVAASSAPVPSAPVPPTPAPEPPVQTRVVPTAPATAAAQAQVSLPATRASQGAGISQGSMQIAANAPAPPMPGLTSPEGKPAAASGDAAFAGSDPLIENGHLRRLEQKIGDLDFPVEELAAQWAMFEKECPEPTTDAMCLDAKTKVIAGTQKVFESKIQLLDQKITALAAVPQNAIAQREEDEAKELREKMKVALDSFPRVIAHLNKVLEDLKRANEEQ
jgi:hypothetical protein